MAEQRIQVAQPARNEKRIYVYVYWYPSCSCNEKTLSSNQMSGSNGLAAEMRVLVNSQMGLKTSAMDFSSQVRLSQDNPAFQKPNCPFNRQTGLP